jgi:antagonist of KipI
MMSLKIVEPGYFSTLQDLGRPGFQKFGVPVSGPMDVFAFLAANRLVGNQGQAAALEVGPGGVTVEGLNDHVVAVCGAGFSLEVDGDNRSLWMSFQLNKGDLLQLTPSPEGTWVILSVAGGFSVEPVLGSRSTYLNGGFGGFEGRRLRAGDILSVSPATQQSSRLAGQFLPIDHRPEYSDFVCVSVLTGPQGDHFSQQTHECLFSSEYIVSLDSDRIGYRLSGPPLEHIEGADILSEGIVMGAIQVPASHQPLIMMADRPTSGGYAKIGVIAQADLPLLAQCPPGIGRVRFTPVSLEAAHTQWKQMINNLAAITRFDDFESTGWIGALQ